MIEKYQNMNQYRTTTCGIIINHDEKSFQFYPCQHTDVCYGKKVSKKKVFELLEEVQNMEYKELPISWGGKKGLGTEM